MHTTKIKPCKVNTHVKMKCEDRKNGINFKWTKLIYRHSEGEVFKALEIICIFTYCIYAIMVLQKKANSLCLPALLFCKSSLFKGLAETPFKTSCILTS